MPPRYAHVVPVLRTPFGVNGFDYLIPEQRSDVQIGSLVTIPFRRQMIVGLVTAISSQSSFAKQAKAITGIYIPIIFPKPLLEMLRWTAKRTFSSEPTVLAAWVRHLPKRPDVTAPRSTSKPTSGLHLNAAWTTQPMDMLTKAATEYMRKGRRTLIIVPWLPRLRAYKTRLPHAQVLHSELNAGDAFRAWTRFATEPGACLITTRLGAWLAPWADQILLDEPENDDHKQDELAPRYDARLILVWCAKQTGIPVESFGLTPPLHVEVPAPLLLSELTIHPRRPGGSSRIPCIQADSLERLRAHEGPRIIFHPVRGMAARLVCRECGWRAPCVACGFELSAEPTHARCHLCGTVSALPEACAVCQGIDLGKSTPGIEKLKQLWSKHEADIDVEWRNLSNEDVDAPIPDHALVLVTDAPLLGGAVEDVRRRERTCIAYRRLVDRVATSRGELIIQCPEAIDPITNHPEIATTWQTWLTPEGFDTFRKRERQDRALFQYPPATRLAKCLIDGNEATALTWGDQARKILPKAVVMRGPFFVPYRPSTRSERQVWHLLFPPESTEEQLLTALTPLASTAIIDLDPIAYFK